MLVTKHCQLVCVLKVAGGFEARLCGAYRATLASGYSMPDVRVRQRWARMWSLWVGALVMNTNVCDLSLTCCVMLQRCESQQCQRSNIKGSWHLVKDGSHASWQCHSCFMKARHPNTKADAKELHQEQPAEEQ